MSYSRWSSEIENAIPPKKRGELLRKDGYSAIRAEHERRGTVVSDWYIFWHCCGDDTLNGQRLAIWHVDLDDNVTLGYQEVKLAYETDVWPHKVVTQKDHMRRCVKTWLDEVEEAHKDAII